MDEDSFAPVASNAPNQKSNTNAHTPAPYVNPPIVKNKIQTNQMKSVTITT